ncbi:hypothetical protein [Leuconostoc citreum]|uniref:hypothetical protein n=1 Tax=Leuconostoc citreum TaxID=33964 RepID=UPI00209CCFEA|nr:hypothetical protein [Leuconostoc citreum]MCP1275799.1 hypothetical protein [Leuconostoc citreum]
MFISNVCLLVIWPHFRLLHLFSDPFYGPYHQFLGILPINSHVGIDDSLDRYHTINCHPNINSRHCNYFVTQSISNMAIKKILRTQEKALDKTIQDPERMVDKTPLTNPTIVSYSKITPQKGTTMNCQQYLKRYKNDNLRRHDALPEPNKAFLIASELSRRYIPEQITIRSRVRLSQWFNISVPSLIRLEHLVANYHYHKFCPLKQETISLPKVDNR